MLKPSSMIKAFASVCAAIAFAGAAYAHDLRVALDASAPLRLSAPAEGVAIGNPAIAGVSVQNDRLLFVTGRSYGTTNLVVVAADGRVIYNGRVTVQPDETNAVMLTRGAETQRLECTPLCRPRSDAADRPTGSQ
ncbi:MAG: pilus assembly protein N-terminal domain-containing protein [Caulobacterales bacterium]